MREEVKGRGKGTHTHARITPNECTRIHRHHPQHDSAAILILIEGECIASAPNFTYETVISQ